MHMVPPKLGLGDLNVVQGSDQLGRIYLYPVQLSENKTTNHFRHFNQHYPVQLDGFVFTSPTWPSRFQTFKTFLKWSWGAGRKTLKARCSLQSQLEKSKLAGQKFKSCPRVTVVEDWKCGNFNTQRAQSQFEKMLKDVERCWKLKHNTTGLLAIHEKASYASRSSSGFSKA